jgi:hypothetical protein
VFEFSQIETPLLCALGILDILNVIRFVGCKSCAFQGIIRHLVR